MLLSLHERQEANVSRLRSVISKATNANLIAPLVAMQALFGCSDEDSRSQRPLLGSGTLELEWSIDGRRDAEVCEEVGAVTFEAVLFDQGYFIGDVDTRCDDFEASIELFVDDYLVRSTLLDVEGYAALGRVVEDFVTIEADRITRRTMDFPSPGRATAPESPPDGGIAPDAGSISPDASLAMP